MRIRNLDKIKRVIIKTAIATSLVFLVCILVYQYIMLFDLKRKNIELVSKVEFLDEQIENIENQIQDYDTIMQDENLLKDYAEHNNYYKTQEVYKVK
ncbi:MAG: hypothetical protein IJW82_06555 [Clostridia bacterium]|nr:hypothetical protein [Clostridia bacterium]